MAPARPNTRLSAWVDSGRSVACDELGVGQVGYVTANIKRLSDVRIGDTITDALRAAETPLPGYKEPHASRVLRALSGHA